jgi:hypothetical protein
VTYRTKLSSILGLVLLSSACSFAQSGDQERIGASSADLLVAPTATLIKPPPPPPPADPNFVGDASSIAIIEADADKLWATWFANVDDVGQLRQAFQGTGSADFAIYQQRLDALVKMYDLLLPIDRVRAMRFLDRLHAMCNVLLANRDDHRGAPMDPFRGRVMKAWGSITANRDNKWNTDPVSSGDYIYAMAAFARRVADNPTLFCQDSLVDAVRFTTAAFETYMEFHDELYIPNGSTYAWYNEPLGYAGLTCDNGASGCEGYRDRAGQPIAYNEGLSMMRAMAEAALAANSALYRNSHDGSGDDVLSALRMFYMTSEGPVVIARNVQWFLDSLSRNFWSNGELYYYWVAQPGNDWAQDTPHAQYEIRSIVDIFEMRPRLDPILAANGHSERVRLDPIILSGFSNTFLLRVWTNDYSDKTGTKQNILAENVVGDAPKQNRNMECAGFTALGQIDNWAWERCRDSVFHSFGSAGDSLRVDNHAALLRYRQGPKSNPAQQPPPQIAVACGSMQTLP